MAASAAGAATIPRFEDYPVQVNQPAPQHAPMLESRPLRTAPFSEQFIRRLCTTKRIWRRRWTMQPLKPFAGHYRISEWGCGTGCQESAIIDNITGTIYGYLQTDASLDFRPDSRLLIVNPGLDEAVAQGYMSDQHTSYWRWNGDGLELVKP